MNTKIKSASAFIAASALAMSVAAAETPPADLPPEAAAMQTLFDHPTVRAAQAGVRSAQAEQARLKAGEYEYTVHFGAQHRSVARGPDFNEWEAGVERGLRLPTKARLDAQIGARGVEEAQERVGDARHETARELLGLWYGLLQARTEAGLWRQQVALLKEQSRIVDLRVKRGDAARLDALLAESAQAQADSLVRQAEGRQAVAEAELKARFPELPAPGDATADPVLPPGGEADWIEHTLEHNHELLALQRAGERLRLVTRRTEANRMPDPSLGLRYANEQGGDENLFGVSISLPLPGAGRSAQARAWAGQAEAMTEQEAALRRRLTAQAAGNWLRASAGVDSWRRLGAAAEAVERHATLARRAYEMGELGLSETLLARRSALETLLAAEQARLAANEAIARLLLDAHRLWLRETVAEPHH